MTDQAAVFFKLLFTGTTYADAPLVARQVGPHPLEPRHGIFELCQLDLEVRLVREGVGREDVEDDLGAIDDLDSQVLFQVARLRGTEVVVEEDDVPLVRLDRVFQLLDLAGADVSRDVDLMPLLQHGANDDQTSGLGQPPKLVQGIIGRPVTMGKNNPYQNCSFLTPQTLDAICINQGGT